LEFLMALRIVRSHDRLLEDLLKQAYAG
jgi:hypothetical protein